MIKKVEYKNYRVLRDSSLPLGRVTLIVGPNGCGKTTALHGIRDFFNPPAFARIVSAGALRDGEDEASITISFDEDYSGIRVSKILKKPGGNNTEWTMPGGNPISVQQQDQIQTKISQISIFNLQADAISAIVALRPKMTLSPNGSGLAGVLDRLRDGDPEKFEALNDELQRCFPEFDRILFETPQDGYRSLILRTKRGGFKIPAADLSQGTLLGLAILTIVHLPDPPAIVGFEEPDRGLHPRLLRDMKDAIYRLAYPEQYGHQRPPVQVIATTHSPYMLDLFREHPEEIVITEKIEDNVSFKNLSEIPDMHDILEDTSLGEVWYSGILGGVPAKL